MTEFDPYNWREDAEWWHAHRHEWEPLTGFRAWLSFRLHKVRLEWCRECGTERARRFHE
jgi:hypothetical protein